MSNPTHVRVRVALTGEVEKNLKFYLDRTTLFWNFMTENVKEEAIEYVNGPSNEATADAFVSKIASMFEHLVDLPDFHNDPEIKPKWRTYVHRIRELPRHLLLNRLDDLTEAYETAKTDRAEGRNPGGLPRPKKESSSHSVRFDKNDFTFDGETLRINGPKPVLIDLRFQTQVDFATMQRAKALAVTRRPLNHASRTVGPVTGDESTYVLTFFS